MHDAEQNEGRSKSKRALLARLLANKGVGATKSISPRSSDGPAPLSYAQSRLWFLEQLTPGGAGYNVSGALRLQGRLDVDVLQRALHEVVRRHESLRTTFEDVGGEPVQRIHPRVDVPLLVEEIGTTDDAAREQQALEIAREEATRPFDLALGPLLRTRLLRLSADDHELVLTMHHIVSDGWSIGVLVREISTLYQAFLSDAPSPLPSLPIQYPDYAVWQRESLSSEHLDAQLRYWTTHLEPIPMVLELPTDRPHPPTRTFHGATLERTLSPELKRAVLELGRTAGATEFMTLLAVFGVLLSRYSRQSDLVVGSPIANRTRKETEGLIGFFVNTLALGLHVDSDVSFDTLLADVKARALAAYANQDLPFEQLVNALQVERAMSRSPVFQVMFVLQNAPAAELTLPGLEITPHEVAGGVANFELTLVVAPRSGGYVLQWEYNTDLFDTPTIERMANHFEVLLDGVIAHPQRRIGDVSLLTEPERRQLVVEWNDTRADYSRDALVHGLFEAQVDRTPDAPALVFEDRTVSYRELDALANRIAHRLRSSGVGLEDRVAVVMLRSVELLATLLGVLKAGAAYVPIAPTYPPDRIAYMIADSGARVVVTHRPARDVLGANEATVIEADDDTLRNEPSARLDLSLLPSVAAYMIYTSGSTGRPKGVVDTHDGVVNRLEWMKPGHGVDHSDVFLQKTPFTFDVSVWELFCPLIIGAQLVIARPEGHKDTAYLCDLVERTRITTMHFVPSMLEPFLDEPTLGQCASLRRVVCSGEALAYATTRRFHQRLDAELYNLYGPTEASIDVTAWRSSPDDPGPVVPIGHPIANVQTYVLDERMQPVPVGVPGELHLGGIQLARGYGGRPALTAERFVPDPFASGQRLYKTGDLARWRPDGAIEFLGRLDHQVKLRGFRIELGEIEAALSSLDEIREVVVVAREDVPGDTRLVAYVVATEPEETLDADALREPLGATLPDYMVPSAFVVLDALPLSPNGKVDRRALPAPERGSSRDYVPPQTAAEVYLASLFAEVLTLDTVGMEDDFFERGGHSLLATRLVSRLSSDLGISVELKRVFEHPTPSGLLITLDDAFGGRENTERVAQSLSGRAPHLVSSIPRRDPDIEPPLSFAQSRLWFLDRLAPGSTGYNVPGALRLHGRLDVDVLQRALHEVVRRHESLRTTFEDVGGEPVQRIHPHVDVPLLVEDISSVENLDSASDLDSIDGTAREQRALEIAREEATRPFDLARGPLLRTRLLRLSADDHELVLTMHHIVSDGWSIGVLVREISTLYQAFLSDTPSPLPSLPIQYPDYAVWQRESLSSEHLDAQLRYWTEHLEPIPMVLELPTDRPHPPTRTFHGATLERTLSPDLKRAVLELGRTAGATEFMTLLAVFGVLLSRYSRQPDLVVGSPIANRTRKETEGLIGFFVNTLALGLHVDSDASFDTLLADVKARALAAYANQDLPFEQLVNALQVERAMSRSPVFQVMFVLQNAPAAELTLPGLEITPHEVAGGVANFELTLVVAPRSGGYVLQWEYNTDLFDTSTIDRMATHFEVLLGGVIAHPERRIGDVSLLTEPERRQLVVEWNDTRADYSRDALVHGLFEAQVDRTPDAPALVFEDRTVPYRELDMLANRIAHRLRRSGVRLEDRVAVVMLRSVELLATLLGVLKAGAAYVPIAPTYPPDRIAYMIADSGARVVVTHRPARDVLGATDATAAASGVLSPAKATATTPDVLDATKATVIEVDANDLHTEPSERLDLPMRPSVAAYMIYTSGSTGRPKGVVDTHDGVVNRLEWMKPGHGVDHSDVFLQKTPFTFDVSVWELFCPLIIGAQLVIARPEGHKDTAYLCDLVERTRITTMHFVPSMLEPFLDEPTLGQCASLRRVVCSGEALAYSTTRRFHQRLDTELYNLYGPTEASIDVTAWRSSPDDPGPVVPIGHPIANVQTYVLDERMQPVPVGVPGELHLGGIQLARGYGGRPALTAERFVPDPFVSGQRLYKTGDLARWRPDGAIEFLGRLDHQVKLRGFRIELGEIEAALSSLDEIREVVVVAREDVPGDTRLVAYVVATEPGNTLDVHALREPLGATLPDYMVPSAIVVLDALPLSPNGKVDRRALPAPERGSSRDYVPPQTAAEVYLASLFAEVLTLDTVGMEDDFFERGGHSLLATRLVSRLSSDLGISVELKRVFEHPTPSGLLITLDDAFGGRENTERVAQSLSGRAPHSVSSIPRRDPDIEPPLSFAQSRLWFLDRLAPGSTGYNVPGALRLHGRLDVDVLQRALHEVVRRHESLRTTFEDVGGEPVQRIHPNVDVPLLIEDISTTDDAAREQQALEIAREEATRPFDLARGPLLRTRLLRLSADDHELVLTMHHIVSDGWSIGVLVREISTLYQAFLSDAPSPLPSLPIQYPDYAVWQRESLSSEHLDAQLRYWTEHLEPIPMVLELPTDRPHPPTRTFHGATLERPLSPDLKRAVLELGRTAGATEFMTLLAVFGVLLSRYSRQSDLVVGSPIANRTRKETEGLIGFFVNTLALGLHVDPNASFDTLLADVKARALAAYANQDLPFEQLVNALQVERAMSRSPVFQVMFVLQNAPAAELTLPGLEITPHEVAGGVANFELTLVVAPRSGGYVLQWEYNTDLFDTSTIDRMATHFEVLLGGVIAHPERRIGDVSLLTEPERRQLVVEWNDTQADYSRDALVHGLFEAQVDRTPDAPALVFEDRTVPYRELDMLANRIAHRLRRSGVGLEDRVAVVMLRSVELLATLLGVLKAGAAYVPIDPTYPPDRIAYMIADSGARVVVTHRPARDVLGATDATAAASGVLSPAKAPATTPDVLDATEATVIDADADDLRTEPPERLAIPLHPLSAAYMIYTSGSTGRPKGVVDGHEGVVNRLQWMKPGLGVDHSDVFVQKTPFTFDVSVWELFCPLIIGAQLVIARPEGHKDTAYLCDLVERTRVTTMHFVPSMLEPFLDEPTLGQCASVRRVICSGEALAYATTRRFHQRLDAELHNLYGPTEASIEVTWWRSSPDDPGPVVPIGHPIANVQTYVLDERMQPVPVGVPGELHLGGIQVARGYGGRPALTAERFVPDPFASGQRLYKTGDLARWRPDGAIEYLGRLDHQVKVRGFRIELGEIEAVLSSLDELREVVVMAREDVPGDTRLVAYVVATDPDSTLDVHVLREPLEAKLPDYMVPSAFVVLDALPLSPSGKVDRRSLPRPRIERAAIPEERPRDPLDERLCAIFAEILGVPRVGIHDDFFELGGHSLLAIRFVSRVRDELGFDVPLREVFDCPTVAKFKARMVAGPSGAEATPISRRTTTGPVPLSASQIRHWRYAQVEDGSNAFCVRAALRLRGQLDIDALRRVVDEVVRRHESLRTTFHDDNGVVTQQIHDAIVMDFAVDDLSDLPRAELETREQVLVKEASDCPFDLAHGPTLRIRLLRLAPDEHILVYTVHHIVFDGWSSLVLTEELLALYDAYAAGRPSPLPEPRIHYADYAAWRHETMQGAPLDEQLEYWMSRLRGMPLKVELPTDRPLPVPRRFEGDVLARHLDETARKAISEVVRASGVTDYMLMLAVLGVFLSDVSGRDSVGVVSPIAGRRHPDSFRLIGYFVNWLPHLVHVKPDESFSDLLQRVREQTLGAYMHQDAPFETILDALGLDPDPSIRPELQVVLAVEHFPSAGPQLAELNVEPVAIRPGVGKFDLALFVFLSDHGINLNWEYNQDLFDEATVVRLAERFEQRLRRLTTSPHERIGLARE